MSTSRFATIMHADLMHQGFMKPQRRHKPKAPAPIVACELCQNWHREGIHTLAKIQAGARVYVLGRLFGASEEYHGNVVTGATRLMRVGGVGSPRPHVRVAFDADSEPRWICVDELRQR